jgi:cysteine desulfurase/selenocysteine lyase
VIDEMVRYYKEYRANVHRAAYKESECATREYELARKKIAAFIGGEPGEILFTSGATASANMLLRSLEESHLTQSGNIVTSTLEHHAQFVPLQELARRKSLEFRVNNIDQVPAAIDQHTCLVGVTLASNVTGEIVDLSTIVSKKGSAILVVDATAALGHIPVDVRALGCDALYFSGHKMLGPTGVGVLWVKRSLLEKLRPSTFGGHMVSHVSTESSQWSEIPDRFEAGTPNIAGVIGLGKAVEYLTMLGGDAIREHLRGLVEFALKALKDIPEVTLYAAPAKSNVGTLAFTIKGIHPHDIAEILSRHNVKIRAGHHCAIPVHDALGISATVRASLHVYNAKEDIDMLVEAIRDAIKIFSR